MHLNFKFSSTPLVTFVIGLLGVFIFMILELPLPWLLGTLFSCLIAAFFNVKLEVIKPLNEGMRTIIGVAVGSMVNMTLLESMINIWPTLILMPIMIIIIGVCGVPYFYYFCRYDWPTSYYAAMPGGLQDMIVFGEEAGGNARIISLVHATRVIIIVSALPFFLKYFWQLNLDNAPGLPLINIQVSQIIVLIICCLAGWQIARYFNMFGASILGPLIVAALASLTGVLITRPPAEAIWLAQYFIGISVGVKYVGITISELRRDVAAGIGYCAILLTITLFFIFLIYSYNLAPMIDSLLSFLPGGQAELVVLALVAGADMIFVVSHHLLRIVIVIFGAPIFQLFFK